MAFCGNSTLCLEKNPGCSEFAVNKFIQDSRIPNSEAQEGQSFRVLRIDTRIVLTRLSVNAMGSAGLVLSK